MVHPTRKQTSDHQQYKYVCQLVLEGPWRDKFRSSLEVAIEHGVRTYRKFRRSSETFEVQEGPGTTRCGSKNLPSIADMMGEVQATNQSWGDHQQATQQRKRRINTTTFKTWYAPPGTALVDLMLHLHLSGVSAIGTPCHYQHMVSPSEPDAARAWVGSTPMNLSPTRRHG